MSKIDCILNKCIWLLHEAKHFSGLDYLSRIDCEDTAWYFWLKEVKGVYEFKLRQVSSTESGEKSSFFLRYYPDLEDDCFEDYSCVEQIVRMGELFEQGDVSIAKEIDVCPCCGTNQCEHEHCTDVFIQRSKGIPKLLQRKTLSPKLFVIGNVDFDISYDVLTSMTLTTSNLLLHYAVNGVQGRDKDGLVQELVGKNGIERNIAGTKLCMPFHEFLRDKLLGMLSVKSIKQITSKEAGTAIFNFGDGDWREKASPKVEKVIVRNEFYENQLL